MTISNGHFDETGRGTSFMLLRSENDYRQACGLKLLLLHRVEDMGQDKECDNIEDIVRLLKRADDLDDHICVYEERFHYNGEVDLDYVGCERH